MSQWPRTFRTVRHLRPSQVIHRLLRTAMRKLEMWRGEEAMRQTLFPHGFSGFEPNPRPAVSMPDLGQCPRPALSELAAGQLTLLNQSLPFRGGADWKMIPAAYQNSLWTYTLHYHEWVYRLLDPASVDEAQCTRVASKFIQDWIVSCAPGRPGFAHYPWNSFAIACRLQWWARIYWHATDSFWAAGPSTFRRDFCDSFAMQAQYLLKHIEWDLRANHLMRDASGLAFAGAFLPGEFGRRCLDFAARLADSQVEEQILEDDTHFERSVSYQCHFMEDLCHLCAILPDGPVRSRLRERLHCLMESLAWLIHPDLLPVQFNDAALNSYATPASLLAACRTLDIPSLPDPTLRPQGVRYFPAFGIVASHLGLGALFFDVGQLGVDYQPGHAHADTLTVEMSIASKRFIVDPGCFDYDNSANRAYDRSTLAHNTVVIDHANSSEMWHVFRVGSRAMPIIHDLRKERNGAFTCTASHDGYRNLSGRPIHQRTVSRLADGSVRIIDHVFGNGVHAVEGGFLIAPEWTVSFSDGNFIAVANGVSSRIRITSESPGIQYFSEITKYHPHFGIEQHATRLIWRASVKLPLLVSIIIDWS